MDRERDLSAREEDRPEELDRMPDDQSEDERPPEHPHDRPTGPGVEDAFRSGG